LALSCGREENPAWARDSTAPAAISDLRVAAGTDSTVLLRWTAPGDDGAEGSASDYDLRYGEIRVASSNWVDAWQAVDEPIPAEAGSPESLLIEGLPAAAKLYFAVRASDEVPNWSALSNLDSLILAP
ncbi:MAG: hypothetical protein EHM19_12490, partial [Candidatus Latescibacterota bacterium]